ncbi:MAG: hypothetical protein ABSA69_08995, partial [Verrucomicrobiota bacterium]
VVDDQNPVVGSGGTGVHVRALSARVAGAGGARRKPDPARAACMAEHSLPRLLSDTFPGREIAILFI